MLRKPGLTPERIVGQTSTMKRGDVSVEANFQGPEVHQTEHDEEEIELNLTTDSPIIFGKKTLIEMATLSLTIAEDMSS
jgi:hypothetical protein